MVELPAKSDLEDREKKLFETSKFLAKMVAAGIVFRAILFLEPSTVGLQEFLASITTGTLNFFGLELLTQGFLIISPEETYLVTQDCLGWKSMAVFSGLVFASAKKFRDHIKPLIVGMVAITLINFLRVVTTVYLSYLDIISFEIIHTLFWKWGLSLSVLVIWAIWLKKTRE